MNKTKDVEQTKSNNKVVSDSLDYATEVWEHINWKKIQGRVFKLQKEIYKASAGSDVRKVRKLQKRLIRSYKAKLLAVRRVTQDNRGKRTAGIDRYKSPNPKQRLELVKSLKIKGIATPTRRVWIPKPNGEKRPLGIPTMYDRAMQALVKMALEPEWEAKFEPNSYGFRPARRCQDAIQQIKLSIQHKPKFVLDADIAKCFDRIDHQKLLQKTGLQGKLRRQIRAWLNSGVMDENVFAKTEAGTPQGGVISPLLANIALHGMEEIVRKCTSKNKNAQMALNFIRYADDFVVMHKDKDMILKCKEAIQKWLTDIGLELKPEKTRVTHTLEPELSEDKKAGFDFLGFHIQQYKAGKHKCSKNLRKELTGYVTLITPTQKSIKNHQKSLGIAIRNSISQPIDVLIKRVNPIIKGWTNYYQYSDIKTAGISGKQDQLMYIKLRSWAKRNCGSVTDGLKRYYHLREILKADGTLVRRKEWCNDTTANQAVAYHHDISCSSTDYVKVKGNRSPYDGDLKYWSKRLQTHPELTTRQLRLLKRQKCKCSWCGDYFMDGDVMEVDHIIPKSLGGKDKYDNLQLLHGHCHDQKTRIDGSLNQKQPNKAKTKARKPDELDMLIIEREHQFWEQELHRQGKLAE